MKKLILGSLIAAASLLASDSFLEKLNSKQLLQKSNYIITKYEKKNDNLFIVNIADDKGNNMSAYTDSNATYLLVGQAYDLDNASKLGFTPDLKSVVPDFTVGSGSEEYTVFINPLCGACKQMENILFSLKNIDFKINFVLMFSDNMTNSKKAASYILDSSTDEEKVSRLIETQTVNNYSSYIIKNPKNVESKLKSNSLSAYKLEVTGTPTMFNIKTGADVNWVMFLKGKHTQELLVNLPTTIIK